MKKRHAMGLIAGAVLAALVAWPSPARAGAAGRLPEVRGAHAIRPDAVRSILARAGWAPEAPGPALAALEEAYFHRGYLNARLRVTPGRSDSTTVLLVSEGEPARVGRARVTGAAVRGNASVRDALGLEPGRRFHPDDLTSRMRALLQSYDDAGYPFAQVWVDSIGYDAAANTVDVSLFVVEGTTRTIEAVDVQGLQKTRPSLAARIAGVTPGAPYSARVLRDAYLRMVASGVFAGVQYPTVRLSADGRGVDVVIPVDEPKRSHSFSSALGYATDQATNERKISGTVNLQLNNVGGTLRDLGVFWSDDGNKRRETRVGYRDRFFLGRSLALGVTLHQIGLDTLYTWQSAGLQVERPVVRLGGTLVGASVAVNADRNVFSVGDLERSLRLRMGLGVSAVRGSERGRGILRADVRVTYARKRSRYRKDARVTSLGQVITEVETDGTLRVRPIVRLRNQLVYRGLESSEDVVPISEQFYLGGARTLRGYKENQFHGRRVALARNEVLLGRSALESVYLFADVGYILQEALDAEGVVQRTNLVRTGYGFGLRTRSRVGNVDLSFGIGEKLSLQQTKVHVLLEQNF